MANTKHEAAEVLRSVREQLDKAKAEINKKIDDLVAAAAADDVGDELQAAIDALKPAAQALDDIVPDPAAPPSEPPTDTGTATTGA